jgi:hypothetical protein
MFKTSPTGFLKITCSSLFPDGILKIYSRKTMNNPSKQQKECSFIGLSVISKTMKDLGNLLGKWAILDVLFKEEGTRWISMASETH